MMKKYALLTLALLFTTTACVTIHSGGKTYKLSDLFDNEKKAKEKAREERNRKYEELKAMRKELKQALQNDDVNYVAQCVAKYTAEEMDGFGGPVILRNGNSYFTRTVDFAYGHGSCEVARLLESHGLEGLRGGPSKMLVDRIEGKISNILLGDDTKDDTKNFLRNLIKCGANVNARIDGYYLRDYMEANNWGDEYIEILSAAGGKRTGDAQRDKDAAYARKSKCEHLYEGRSVTVKKCETGFLSGYQCRDSYNYEVVGFSPQTGRASVRKGRYGDIEEVYCEDINE